MYTKLWPENTKGRDHSEHLGEDGRIILEWILEKQVGKAWIELIWLRTEINGGLTVVNTVMNLRVP
jgi:hypothetical protein